MIGLEFYMKNKKISNTELAETLGIKKQNVSRWFSGERDIPEKYLDILTNMFNCSIKDLTNEKCNCQILNPLIGLTYIRQIKGISMQQLADLIGVSSNTINLWEKGTLQITEHRLEQLENALNISRNLIINEINDEIKVDILYSEMNNIKNKTLRIRDNIKG